MQISYRLSTQGCLGRTWERKRLAEYATNTANVFGEYCAINIDYFMVGECVRFLFTSCERSLNERVSAANE